MSLRSQSLPVKDGDEKRTLSFFRRRAKTDILGKNWDAYSDSDVSIRSIEDRRSVCSSTETDTDTGSPSPTPIPSVFYGKRRIKHFRTIAIIVRACISLLPKSYFTAQILFEEIDGEKELKAGTLEAIIEVLTPLDSTDGKYFKDFFLGYRYFVTKEEVFEKLIQRFHWKHENADQLTIVPLRVINVIRRWIKEFFYDFEDDEQLIQALEKFCDQDIAQFPDPSISKWSESLKKILKDQCNQSMFSSTGIKRSQSFPTNPLTTTTPQANSSPQLTSQISDFTHINPVDIFRQLSIMETSLFKLISPRDLYYKTRQRKNEKCPNLMKLISHFNNVSFWVAKEICYCHNLKQRTIILKRFIHIAFLCFEYNNFNTCLEIIGGLSMSCVQRLKKTWKNLSAKYEEMWEELQSVMSPTQNYITYRNYFKTIEKPAFPYFGMYLSDLTLIQEKYQSKVTGGLLNFKKMKMIASVLLELQSFQTTLTFPFGSNPMVQFYLESRIEYDFDEDEIYSMSKAAEPPEDVPKNKSRRGPRKSSKQDISTL